MLMDGITPVGELATDYQPRLLRFELLNYQTGDVGVAIDSAKFQVIDRVKNVFKLSQGHYHRTEI